MPPPIKRTETGRAKLRRQRPPDQIAAIEPQALTIGKVIWEWNNLHADLFRILWALVGDHGKRPRDFPTALWYIAQSDDFQRRLIEAIAGGLLHERPAELRHLRWLLKTIHQMSAYRNIATHMYLEVYEGESGYRGVALQIDGTKRAAALKHTLVGHKFTHFWDDFASDLYVLSQYALQLGFQLTGHPLAAQTPLPYRPRLKSPPAMREVNQLVDRLANRPRKRRPRRKASAGKP
ncbi:MAG: hypothetical protein QOH65_1735 [Methylobacteriaceae bacterium]|jgi:hypothetical protein|nr:hypothetical protein [Methylobacteriaceae bacterium]